MTRKPSQFRHESLQDSKAIVRYLNALSEGFEKGTLQFRDQEGEIVLEPSGMIRFEVTATRKSGRYSMALKLSWKQMEEDGKDPGPLLINGEAEPEAGDDEASTSEVSTSEVSTSEVSIAEGASAASAAQKTPGASASRSDEKNRPKSEHPKSKKK